jgi:Condensation domain
MSSITERLSNYSPEQLRQLARRTSKKETSGQQIPPRSRENNVFPVSFAQERMWFLDRLFPGSAAYNMPFAFHFKIPTQRPGGVVPDLQDVIKIQRGIISEIVKRHEIWRTSFSIQDGIPVQVIHPAAPVPLEIVTLHEVPESERAAAARQIILDRANKPFDLSG